MGLKTIDEEINAELAPSNLKKFSDFVDNEIMSDLKQLRNGGCFERGEKSAVSENCWATILQEFQATFPKTAAADLAMIQGKRDRSKRDRQSDTFYIFVQKARLKNHHLFSWYAPGAVVQNRPLIHGWEMERRGERKVERKEKSSEASKAKKELSSTSAQEQGRKRSAISSDDDDVEPLSPNKKRHHEKSSTGEDVYNEDTTGPNFSPFARQPEGDATDVQRETL